MLMGLLLPIPAAAHLALKSSRPASGDTVQTGISTVFLAFTERVELRFTSVLVVSATGDTIRGTLASVDSLGREVELRLSQPLLGGRYVVLWRTAGADGHAVSGNFDFAVRGVAPLPTPTGAAGVHRPVPAEPSADVNQLPHAVGVRWLNFLFAVLLIGGVVVQLLASRVRAPAQPEFWTAVSAGARRIALFAAVGSLLLAVPRLAIQLRSLSDSVAEPGMVGVLLRETNWGRGWVLQLLGGAGYLLAVFAATPGAFGGWLLAGAAAVMIAFGISFSGHAAGVEQMQIINVGNNAIHLIAVSAWIGTLAHIVLTAVPAAIRRRAYADLGVLIRAFSPMALGAAAIAVITGSVSALSHVGPLSDFWTTEYGRMLLLKLLAVAGVAISGAYNWQRIKPQLGTESATQRLRRSAAAETGLALLVLLATAILVALPPP